MSHRYVCPMRWGDMDAQGHVNNATFLDYLQEARVDYLLSGPPQMRALLERGVVVVQHQVEYREPLTFHGEGVVVDLRVEMVGASRFVIGYDVLDGDRSIAAARTVGAPFDLVTQRLRRLYASERGCFAAALAPGEPLRTLPRVGSSAAGLSYALKVRWSDLDSYGHVNNVKYFDYIQEGRIAMLAQALGWRSGEDAEPWVVVRQDIDYLRPIDFRVQPYAVRTGVVEIGNRSLQLAADIVDPEAQVRYAAARTVLVAPAAITEAGRRALEPWLLR